MRLMEVMDPCWAGDDDERMRAQDLGRLDDN